MTSGGFPSSVLHIAGASIPGAQYARHEAATAAATILNIGALPILREFTMPERARATAKAVKERRMAVTDFTHAIARKPARSVVGGVRAGKGPDPNFDGVKNEHAAYCAALVKAGVALTILPPLEAYPDSIFVEDPALVFPEGAILLRPGARSRAGEAEEIAPTLRERFEIVLALEGGHAEGGDILVTPERVMIGLSARTDKAGAEALTGLLAKLGKRAAIVETPKDVLHFKTDCALLDDETVLTTRRLSKSGVFKGFREIIVPDGEEAAANALRVNTALFVGARFRRTTERLADAGYNVVPLAVDEIGRIDAGLSCMSLRWRALTAE
jgi:dimethylargininase